MIHTQCERLGSGCKALGFSLSATARGADRGSGNKYSGERFEGRSGKWFL